MTNTIPNVPRDFKKRPVIIQAIKWTGDNLFDVIKFMSGAPSIGTSISAAKWKEYCDLVQDSGLIIKTLEGQHIATVGDMIIRGVKDEFYPCKPDIFDMTYELSAPSPAGVDGWDVASDILEKLSAAQAIIDGLRGEVAEQEETANQWRELALQFDRHRMTAMAHIRAAASGDKSAIEALGVFAALPPIPGHEITAERDQQAQRIGELEGLLRESGKTIHNLTHPETQTMSKFYKKGEYRKLNETEITELLAMRPRPANGLKPVDLEERILYVAFDVLLSPEGNPSTTVCRIYITPTFSVMGHSNVLDHINYNEKLGNHYAYLDAFDKLWDYVAVIKHFSAIAINEAVKNARQ